MFPTFFKLLSLKELEFDLSPPGGGDGGGGGGGAVLGDVVYPDMDDFREYARQLFDFEASQGVCLNL